MLHLLLSAGDKGLVTPVKEIGVGLLGLGVVGGGVANALLDPDSSFALRTGRSVQLRGVLVRDTVKNRNTVVPSDLLTTEPENILSDPNVNVLIEVMGGENPAKELISRALSQGKHVVTANKEVMAKHGPALIALAADNQVSLLFEASVGGGISIIGPLTKDLLANDIRSIHAIINGTTNYILTRMARDGTEFQEALMEAQEQGYAESDPTNDIEAIDGAYKLAVLASLAFHTRVHADDVFREGITCLAPQDFRYAQELGYAIKLLAIATSARVVDGDGTQGIMARVHPALVPLGHMLAKVDGAYNAIEVEGDLMGRVLFHGMGAGRDATTSAVLGDLMEVVRGFRSGSQPLSRITLNDSPAILPVSQLHSKYYLRLLAADRPGVLAQIGTILGELEISIASVIQKDTDFVNQAAELVVTTHPAPESHMQQAMDRIGRLEVVREISNVIRIEDGLVD